MLPNITRKQRADEEEYDDDSDGVIGENDTQHQKDSKELFSFSAVGTGLR